MINLLENLKLLLHQCRIYLSFVDLSLIDNFDSAGLLSLEMLGLPDFAKLASTKQLVEGVKLADVFHSVETFEALEFQEPFIVEDLMKFFSCLQLTIFW